LPKSGPSSYAIDTTGGTVETPAILRKKCHALEKIPAYLAMPVLLARFEVVTTDYLRIQIVWDVTVCTLASSFRRFE
jgi:hypothetical protein